MQHALFKLFAFAVAAHAIGIPSAAPAADSTASTTSVSPLDFSTGTSCTDTFLGGTCGTNFVDSIPSGCFNYLSNFNDAITSIQVISGFSCVFFLDPNCKGANITIFGTVNALTNTSFDNSLSSFLCFNR